ncbi:MAG: hypothetical protein J6Q72_03160 [Clostridia bacterium]|nr:hypothetical protein [Clostridia bacterium]
MNGKNRCRILKEIRKKIADENGIEYVVSECKYKGDCLGTCPKCEAEVQYLERELANRRSLGRRVAIAGIAAGITLAATGCSEDIKNKLGLGTMGDMMPDPFYAESSEYSDTMGEERPESSKVSDITVDGEMVEVAGEMPESSMPEISNPYDDIQGDFVTFELDIRDCAVMSNDEAFEVLKAWSREYIDYEWQERINFRDSHITEFIVSGVAVIDVYFDEQGAVTKVVISADEPLMGDIPS